MITGLTKQVCNQSFLPEIKKYGKTNQRFQGDCKKSCHGSENKEKSGCNSKNNEKSYSPKGLIAIFSAILGFSSMFFISENRNLTNEKDLLKSSLNDVNTRLKHLETSSSELSDSLNSMIKKQVTMTTISDIAKEVTPSTARVVNEMIMKNRDGNIVKVKSGGSGVFIQDKTTGKMYVLTNSHVIYRPLMDTFKDQYDDPDKYSIQLYTGDDSLKPIEIETRIVILPDGRRAESPYQNPECHDLALLKVSDDALETIAGKIKPAVFRQDLPAIGEIVIAVGNPVNRPVELWDTITAGFISHSKRFMPENPNTKYIQTDAAVNPGNSGGGLFDAKSRLIGINTFHEGDDLGVAISTETILEILKDWGISVNTD